MLSGKEEIPADVRIIAATRRDLEVAIQEQQLREDLYYRLAGVVIHLPALRESGPEDLARLVKCFLGQHGRELGPPDSAGQMDPIGTQG
jgi:transcriptional regulator with PAS, ATPase and Fis domain